MKSWSVSSRAMRAAAGLAWRALALGLLGLGSAAAADVGEGLQCLEETRLDCARAELDALEAAGARDVEVELLGARVCFHEGDFACASRRMSAVLDRAEELDPELAGFPPRVAKDPEALAEALAQENARMLATEEAHAGLVATEVGDIVVVHDPGIEAILVEETVEILQAAKARIAPLLGGDIPGKVRVEFYPDARGFVDASGLPLESIQTTGVVAISKWNRLLITSPRVRGGGYGWKDTVVHEWIHEVVSYNSRERAPIWLQEGIAKSLDGLWRDPEFRIPVQSQGLLANALATGQWITFEQMHPSMAYLPSAEAATQAYAQVSTMMHYLRMQKGDAAISEVLTLLRERGMDAREAVAEVANGGDFEAFEAGWRGWLATLDLATVHVAAMPTALGVGGEDFEADPVLARRKELANLTRLGELMAQRGHHEAALLYYDRAEPEDEPTSPLLVRRRAESLVALGRPVEAELALVDNLVYYPEVAANQRMLAELLLSEGKDAEALEHLRVAADINPFEPEVQQQLSELYAAQGQKERAARHARYVDLLYYRAG
ncbi:MAG: hypothetical protein H6740_22380 [Alphaproteobacteria bacterium]|nr:hypothetical protein [Alphaproteobacteria bacterium]